jgi:very-short-patch-repair endonuclease
MPADNAECNPSPPAGEGARLGEPLGEPSRSGRGGSPTHQQLLARAKWMRANPTEAERKLWLILRAKRLAGYKFKRQVVIDRYIADFVKFEHRLIVEADGSQHLDNPYGLKRDSHLWSQGFKVLRFWNNDIFLQPQPVSNAIWHALNNPSPLAGEGGPEGVGRGGTERRPTSSWASVDLRSSGNFSAPAPSPSLARGEG